MELVRIQRSFSEIFNNNNQPEDYSYVQNYKLKFLKTNNFGTRYIAIDMRNNSKRLIRKINNSIGKKQLESTQKEAIIYKRIRCDNFIHGVLDYFIEKKELYLVMDYYDEEYTLYEFISNKDDETIKQMMMNWCLDLTFAVDYLHTHGLFHGKINMKNVYVNENGRLGLGEMAFTYDDDESTEKKCKESDISSLVDLISCLAKRIGCKEMNDELLTKLKSESSRFLLKSMINLKNNPHTLTKN